MDVQRLLSLEFATNVMSVQILISVRSVRQRYRIHTISSRLRTQLKVVQEKCLRREALRASIIVVRVIVVDIMVGTPEALWLSLGQLLRMLSN
jgi:hypothetical protein